MQKACKNTEDRYRAAKLCWPILGRKRYRNCFRAGGDNPTDVFRVSWMCVFVRVCVCARALARVCGQSYRRDLSTFLINRIVTSAVSVAMSLVPREEGPQLSSIVGHTDTM